MTDQEDVVQPALVEGGFWVVTGNGTPEATAHYVIGPSIDLLRANGAQFIADPRPEVHGPFTLIDDPRPAAEAAAKAAAEAEAAAAEEQSSEPEQEPAPEAPAEPAPEAAPVADESAAAEAAPEESSAASTEEESAV